MYAVIATGGKQYKVAVGDRIKVELLNAEVEASVKLDVLFFANDAGEVFAGKDVADSYATAKVLYNGKGPKINIFTYKPKKNIRKRQGHRQPYTELEITEIVK